MSPETISFVMIFQILIGLFLIQPVYLMVTHRRAFNAYWPFGKNIAAVFCLMEVIIFLCKNISALYQAAYHFVLIGLFVTGGCYLAHRMNRPGLPVIMALTRSRSVKTEPKISAPLIEILVNAAAICIFTYILFAWARPSLSVYFKDALSSPDQRVPLEWSTLVFFVLIAFFEEVVFRLFLQNFLSYVLRRIPSHEWLAILLSSLLFSIGHFGILETWWIKFLQTFIIGIVLGRLMKKYGMEASFAVHAALNIFALFAANVLF